ncbi:hypothetical protein diail_6560 [Diaporthe ilicicola]|nr:hypothetical protein diail_6560 [Diaporthe ilicicola]
MTSAFPSLGSPAYPVALFWFLIAIAPSGTFALTLTYVHHAFWCCVFDAILRWPIEGTIHLSKKLAPRPLHRLAPIISFLWTDVAFLNVARWVQLFVVHASLFPSASGTSAGLDPGRLEPFGLLLQGGLYLCIIQVVHDATVIPRVMESNFKRTAEEMIEDDEDAPPDVVDYLLSATAATMGTAWGCLTDLFVTMALYLEQMAMGTFVNACRNAVVYPARWQDGIFPAAAIPLLLAVYLHVDEVQIYDNLRLRGLGGRPMDRRRTIPEEIFGRFLPQCSLLLADCLRGAVPSQYLEFPPWSCPSNAVVWSEDELRHFYARALTGVPSLVIKASWNHGVLRERHVELWQKAGLPTDLALRNEVAVFVPGDGMFSGPMLDRYFFSGRVIAIFVRLLEVAFGILAVIAGITFLPG